MTYVLLQKLSFVICSIGIGTAIGIGIELNNGKLVTIGVSVIAYMLYEIIEILYDIRRSK